MTLLIVVDPSAIRRSRSQQSALCVCCSWLYARRALYLRRRRIYGSKRRRKGTRETALGVVDVRGQLRFTHPREGHVQHARFHASALQRSPRTQIQNDRRVRSPPGARVPDGHCRCRAHDARQRHGKGQREIQDGCGRLSWHNPLHAGPRERRPRDPSQVRDQQLLQGVAAAEDHGRRQTHEGERRQGHAREAAPSQGQVLPSHTGRPAALHLRSRRRQEGLGQGRRGQGLRRHVAGRRGGRTVTSCSITSSPNRTAAL